MRILAKNKKVSFNYEILEKFEAGISLEGSEVKSLILGKVKLEGSFIKIKNGEVFWVGGYIPLYQPKNTPWLNPERDRKLLLKKREIRYLEEKIRMKGFTLIPLKIYLKKKWIKMEFALAKGKKKYSKKEKIKKREIERKIEMAMKRYG